MRALGLTAVIALGGCCLTAVPAQAYPGIAPGGFHVEAVNVDGTPDLLAGSHPYEYLASFEFNHDEQDNAEGSARDVMVDVPPGFVGNPMAIPRCPLVDFNGEYPRCPPNTQVGTLRALIREGGTALEPEGGVYNLVPPKGFAASFGFSGASYVITENAKLIRGGAGGYRVSVVTNDIPHGHVLKTSEIVWGVPASKAHDAERGCLVGHKVVPPCPTDFVPAPFLTLPTNCQPQAPAILEVDFLEELGHFFRETAEQPQLEGCGSLDFSPGITVQPETVSAAMPTGLRVDVHMPQEESVEGRAEADLKGAVVTFPPGLVVNPSSANGLASCSSAQIALESTSEPACPAASKIGTVEVDTPLIDHPLPGALYLAAQNDNPFNSLLAVYIVIDDPATGVIVKLAGHVEANPATGQLTTTFSENPQFPFEDLKVDLTPGERAPLISPDTCGLKTGSAVFTPWTSPEHPDVSFSPSFEISSGHGGAACAYTPAAESNQPSFQAGTTGSTAGAYSPFVMTLSREQGSQPIRAIDVTLPPGLTGKLAGVARCSDAQIAAAGAPERTGAQEQAAPSCPASSEVGTVDVAAGAGEDPVHVTGHAYLAGPYEGAPFSLAIVTPAVAGPFDLGVVVVRAALYIDPTNAQVTVKSDPIPTILQGIPLDVREITVYVNRNQFTINPTDCEKMTLLGSAISAFEQTAALSDPFQVEGCQGLPFKPSFTVATSAKTSKADGASLTTRVSFPRNPVSGLSGQANVAKVRVELPKQLPSRLTTLQKACTEHQFNANPAGCPPESVVGHATARTPILSAPLEGPAYFVSHGNAAFPELVIVLQGEGVTIQLNGETDIKKGITSSTFNQVPDAPVENFVLTLPEGPHSALSAPSGHLCEQSLIMPTRLTGQNGAVVTQSTRIEVEGCSNKLAIVGHEVKRRTLTVQVYVPAAGSVKITGKGLRSKTKTAKGRETVTIGLSQKQAGRLKTKLRVTYTPKHGKRQLESLALTFKK